MSEKLIDKILEVNYVKDATGHDHKTFEYDQMEDIFQEIYKTNRWRKADGAGSGSIPENAQTWLKILFQHVNKFKIEEIHDFGCGPYFLYKDLQWPQSLKYIGYDVSDIALERADLNCTNPKAVFEKIKSFDDLPGGGKNNLLIVKEVLQHWPHQIRLDFLNSIKNKYKWVLIQGSATSTIPPEFKDNLVFSERYAHEDKANSEVGIWKFNNDPKDSLLT